MSTSKGSTHIYKDFRTTKPRNRWKTISETPSKT